MSAAVVTALILLCTGDICRIADGYPMDFQSESDCYAHVEAVHRALVPTDKPEAAVIMICAEGFGFREGVQLDPDR